MLDLSGRRAFVTGGGKGIGAAIAERLVAAGATVTVGDVDPDAEASVAAIGASFVRCDITDSSDVVRAIEVASGPEGLQILVNKSGMCPTTGPMLEATDEFVARMLDVNVRAQFSVSREGAKRMTGGGAIVNLASIAGLRGGAPAAQYRGEDIP